MLEQCKKIELLDKEDDNYHVEFAETEDGCHQWTFKQILDRSLGSKERWQVLCAGDRHMGY